MPGVRRNAREQLAASYQAVFGSPEGKRVLADLVKRGGVLEVSTVGGDPYATHFRDGRRSLALEVLDRVRWSEMEVLALSQERTAETLADLAGAEPSDVIVETGDQ